VQLQALLKFVVKKGAGLVILYIRSGMKQKVEKAQKKNKKMNEMRRNDAR
jgi:hypothetical protein